MSDTNGQTIEVRVDFLKKVLEEIESMWHQIDSEWGPTPGGLAKSIRDGDEPVIGELRQIVRNGSESGRVGSDAALD